VGNKINNKFQRQQHAQSRSYIVNKKYRGTVESQTNIMIKSNFQIMFVFPVHHRRCVTYQGVSSIFAMYLWHNIKWWCAVHYFLANSKRVRQKTTSSDDCYCSVWLPNTAIKAHFLCVLVHGYLLYTTIIPKVILNTVILSPLPTRTATCIEKVVLIQEERLSAKHCLVLL